MANRTFKAGSTSKSIDVFIKDTSSTAGLTGLAALAFDTSNIAAYYRKGATGTPTAITLATQTVGGAYSSGGFVELDATHMKGVYRLDIPDTVLATAGGATLFLYGATNMAPTMVELEIVAYDPTDAAALGLSQLNLIPGTQDGKTFAQTIMLMAAVLLGKASGLDGTTAVYRDMADAKARVTATVDADGNRTAVTLDAT